MKVYLYSIYDTCSEVFNKPFTEHNNNSATRAFNQAMAENPNKNDYALFCVGEWNDNSGEIVPLKVPVKVATGLEVSDAPVVEAVK
jgi:hypothetical protein